MRVKKTKGKVELISTPKNKCSFKLFIQNQCKSLPVKYPFLTTEQIKNKAVELWHQLSPDEKAVPLTPNRRALRTQSDGKPGKFFSHVHEESKELVFPDEELACPGSPVKFQGGTNKYSTRTVIHHKIEVVSAQPSPEHGILKKGEVKKKKKKRQVSFCDKVSEFDAKDQPEAFDTLETEKQSTAIDTLLVNERDCDESNLPAIVSVFPENLYHKRMNHSQTTDKVNGPWQSAVQIKTYAKGRCFTRASSFDDLNVKKPDTNLKIDTSVTAAKKETKPSKWNALCGKKTKVAAGDLNAVTVQNNAAFTEDMKENTSFDVSDLYNFENSTQDVKSKCQKLASPQKKIKGKKEKTKGNPESTAIPKKKATSLKIKQIKGKTGNIKPQRDKNSRVNKMVKNVASVFKKKDKVIKNNSKQELERTHQRRSPRLCKTYQNQKYVPETNSSKKLTLKSTADRKANKTKSSPSKKREGSRVDGAKRKKNVAIVRRKIKQHFPRDFVQTDPVSTRKLSKNLFSTENLEATSGSPISESSISCDKNGPMNMNNNTNRSLVTSCSKYQGETEDVSFRQNESKTIHVGKYTLRYRSPFKELNHGLKRPCYYNATTLQDAADVYAIDVSASNSPENKKLKLSDSHQTATSKSSRRNNACRNLATAMASKCKRAFVTVRTTDKRKYDVNKSPPSCKSEKIDKEDCKEKKFSSISDDTESSSQQSSQESSQRSFYSVESSDESECERDNQLAQLNFELGNPVNESSTNSSGQEDWAGICENGGAIVAQGEKCIGTETTKISLGNVMADLEMESTKSSMQTGVEGNIDDEDEICDRTERHNNVVKMNEDKATLGEVDQNTKALLYCDLHTDGVTNVKQLVQEVRCTIENGAEEKYLSFQNSGNGQSSGKVSLEGSLKGKNSTNVDESVAPVNCHEQVCEVSTTSEEILANLKEPDCKLTDRRKELSDLRNKVDKVLTEVKDVKIKLQSHEMQFSREEERIRPSFIESEYTLHDTSAFEASENATKQEKAVDINCNSLTSKTANVGFKQTCLAEENNNTVHSVGKSMEKILPISQKEQHSAMYHEQGTIKKDCLSDFSRTETVCSTITPQTGVCKVKEIITPLNAEGIVELTMKKVTKTPQKQKGMTEVNNNTTELDGTRKAKKCLDNQIPVSNPDNKPEYETQVPNANKDNFDQSDSDDIDIFDRNVWNNNEDGNGMPDRDHVFLTPSLFTVVASAVKSSLQKCEMDMIQDIEENSAEREFLQSQGQLTVKRTLRNLRSVVNSSSNHDTASNEDYSVLGPFFSPLCVSPALSGVTKLDTGMTPTVNGAHSAPEESKFVSKDDQHVNDLNLSSVTFDAVQSNICSDIDVTETVRVMKGAMQSPLDTDKNAARESESMEDLNSSSSRYPSAENDHQSGRIAAVVGYLNQSVKQSPDEKLKELEGGASTCTDRNKLKPHGEVPAYKKVLPCNQERSLLDLFDEPEIPMNDTDLLTRSSISGSNEAQKTDILSGIETDDSLFS